MEIARSRSSCRRRYKERQDGSVSKLRTVRDGLRILFRAVRLFESMRPLHFFGGIAAILSITSLGLGLSVFEEFRRTGLVPRYPTAILAAALQIVAFVCATAGLILRSVQATLPGGTAPPIPALRRTVPRGLTADRG